MAYQKPKGTQDLLPGSIEVWQHIEQTAKELCRRFQYQEIRTPIFEQTELFLRSVGETTDVVEKEMYTFEDKGKRSMTLRPEGTAGVVRAYVENKLYGAPDVTKLFYLGPMFRYEQPQAGRYRQLHQFGVEAFGSEDPGLDAEIIALGYLFYQELGIRNVTVEINSVGNQASREQYRSQLQEFLLPIKDQLCKDCQSRYDRNPLRILDCKLDQDKFSGVPSILDSLDEACSAHFQAVQEDLKAMDIPFVINPKLVRGLDYYTHTAFEFKAQGIGAIDTIGAGGRYNGLVEQIGGPEKAGIGFGIGLERTALILEKQELLPTPTHLPDIYLIALGEKAESAAVRYAYQWRKAGIAVEKDYMGKKMKAQMKAAVRSGARFAAILGEDELARGEIMVKDLEQEQQQAVQLDQVVKHIKTNRTEEAY